MITNNTQLYEKATANDIFCYKLQEIKEAIVFEPEVSFDVTKIQKPKIGKKVEHIVFQVANDYKPSTSGRRDQIPVNCSRKRLFANDNIDNIESQYEGNNNGSSPKNCNSNKITNDNDETTSDINRDITRLNITDIFDIQNEPIAEDYRFERKDIFFNDISQTGSATAVDQFHFRNSNERKQFQIQNERRLAHIENGHSEFEKHDSFLTSNQAKEANQPARRKFKSINGYTIESHLKKFVIRSQIIEGRILSRIDEWMCCFTQTMEDILTEILKKHYVSNTTRLWNLQEAMDCTKEIFNENNTVTTIIEKLSSLYNANSCSKFKVKTTISPNSFMRMLGCGVLLIKSLKNVFPDSPEILEGENNLEKLLRDIEEPSGEMEALQLVQTPVVSRSELTEPTERRRNCKLFIINFINCKDLTAVTTSFRVN